MIPKKEYQKIVTLYLPKFQKALALEKWKLEVHVYKSNTVKLKKLGMIKSERMGNCGLSYISLTNKTSDIVLFYDEAANRKDAISTLLHELLHVRFAQLVDMVTIKHSKAHRLEEQVIRILEKMYAEQM